MAIYKPKHLVDIYRMALRGHNEKSIAKALGFTGGGFSQLKKRKVAVRYALKRAWKDREDGKGGFTEYIRKVLSPAAKKTYDKIVAYELDNDYAKVEKLLENEGEDFRKRILIYALIENGFNLTKALKRAATPKKTFNKWKETDPDFIELLSEAESAKRDFYETALVRLINSGDSPATIFANRTLNRNRGYGEVSEIRTVNTNITLTLPLDNLDLDTDTLRKLVNAMNERKAVEAHEIKHIPVPLPGANIQSKGA